jgi:hypothetical protein
VKEQQRYAVPATAKDPVEEIDIAGSDLPRFVRHADLPSLRRLFL